MSCFLIVRGQVEVGPGRFVDGVVSSSKHESPEAAKAEWERKVERGFYEEPFERFEIVADALTLGDVLPEVAA